MIPLRFVAVIHPLESAMQQVFRGIVDYAGLFPPASLSMAESLRLYQEYRQSSDRWALGRYVVAAMRLKEMHETMIAEGIHPTAEDPWRVSLVLGNILPNEMILLNAWRELRNDGSVVIDATEFRVNNPAQIIVLARDLPKGMEHFLEVPQDGPYGKLIKVIGEVGCKAKFRTGGSTPDFFPPAEAVINFIIGCVEHKVEFKFTAGLHHAYRGRYPLTYKPDADEYPMYGFIPLLLATAEIARAGDTELAQAIIEDDDQTAFRRDPSGFFWRDHHYPIRDLQLARRRFTSFGSCSFREPLDGLDGSSPA